MFTLSCSTPEQVYLKKKKTKQKNKAQTKQADPTFSDLTRDKVI